MNKAILLMVMLLVFGCGSVTASSENVRFLADVASMLEAAGKAASYIDLAGIDSRDATDVFKRQIDELAVPMALLRKYEDTNNREISEASEAIRGSIKNIKDGTMVVMQAYAEAISSNGGVETAEELEKIVKEKSVGIQSGWKTLEMSMLHVSHVLIQHRRPHAADADPLPFKVNESEREKLAQRYREAREHLQQVQDNAGIKAQRIVQGLFDYASHIQMIIEAETYGDLKNMLANR